MIKVSARPGPKCLQGYCLLKPRPLVANGSPRLPSRSLPSMCTYLLISSYEDTSQTGLGPARRLHLRHLT